MASALALGADSGSRPTYFELVVSARPSLRAALPGRACSVPCDVLSTSAHEPHSTPRCIMRTGTHPVQLTSFAFLPSTQAVERLMPALKRALVYSLSVRA